MAPGPMPALRASISTSKGGPWNEHPRSDRRPRWGTLAGLVAQGSGSEPNRHHASTRAVALLRARCAGVCPILDPGPRGGRRRMCGGTRTPRQRTSTMRSRRRSSS
jgi:hypothetical protein